jgi:uncharacterized protein
MSQLSATSDLATLLRTLSPVLNPGTFIFATARDDQQLPPSAIVASIREPEGLSIVVEESTAQRLGIIGAYRCAWITLAVHSDLQAVGLTAALATALGNVGMSCNVIAGLNHDHLFVPVDQAARAMNVLQALQAKAV